MPPRVLQLTLLRRTWRGSGSGLIISGKRTFVFTEKPFRGASTQFWTKRPTIKEHRRADRQSRVQADVVTDADVLTRRSLVQCRSQHPGICK